MIFFERQFEKYCLYAQVWTFNGKELHLCTQNSSFDQCKYLIEFASLISLRMAIPWFSNNECVMNKTISHNC